MAKRQQTSGVCQLCQAVVSKAGMTRHLAKCLAAHEGEGTAVSKPQPKTVRLVRLLVEGKYNPDYWLHVEMPATATLGDLDQFLRGIWLECCGHLSAFKIAEVQYSVETAEEAGDPWFAPPWEERSMDVPVGEVLHSGMKFTYEYDFGSTTHLALRVVGEREGKARQERVRLLARNESPQVLCEQCQEKPAAWVDVIEDNGWYCEKCMENTEDGVLPVVNSPRVGVCGYTGQ
jgi:Plasmid pRiA4b ORF-3-like protein